MTEQKNYENYRFKPEERLEINPIILDRTFQVLDSIIQSEVAVYTDVKYDWFHKETLKKAPKNLSEKKRTEEYERKVNIERTLNSTGKEYLTEVAKNALTLKYMLSEVKVQNIDAGKGYDVVARAEAQKQEAKLEVVTDEQDS